MKISQAANASDLSVKTLRYYADIGLVEAHSRNPAGYRIYDQVAIDKLIFVRRSREFGFSIDQCRELLSLYENSGRSSASVKEIASQRLQDIRQKQKELQQLHDQLSRLVEACQGDDQPNCPIIDFLS